MSDIGSRIRHQLRDIARSSGVNTQLLLTRWAMEGFLARLSASNHADRYALKGAMLFAVWEGDYVRATSDVDLQALSSPESDAGVHMVREVVSVMPSEPDGVEFDGEGIQSRRLAWGPTAGDRVVVPVRIGSAKIHMKVDIDFGQPVVPGVERRWYPSLIPDFEPRPIICCPRETMVAEKLAACVEFGGDNTRVRDYHDLWHLARGYSFRAHILGAATAATFAARDAGRFLNRGDGYWERAFDPAMATPANDRIWRNWLDNHAPRISPPPFREVVADVAKFGVPILDAARNGRRLRGTWTAPRGWRSPTSIRRPPGVPQNG